MLALRRHCLSSDLFHTLCRGVLRIETESLENGLLLLPSVAKAKDHYFAGTWEEGCDVRRLKMLEAAGHVGTYL